MSLDFRLEVQEAKTLLAEIRELLAIKQAVRWACRIHACRGDTEITCGKDGLC